MLRHKETNDQLRLLALVARGLGAKGLESYTPPGDEWEEHLTGAMEAAGFGAQQDEGYGQDRAAQVMSFVQATGGEAG